MNLTIRLAKPTLHPMPDGRGFTVHTAYDGHDAVLKIGHVSVAFDGRNIFDPGNDPFNRGDVYQFGEYVSDPVRLCGISCPKHENVGESILRALAADLGFSVSKTDGSTCDPHESVPQTFEEAIHDARVALIEAWNKAPGNAAYPPWQIQQKLSTCRDALTSILILFEKP